MSVVCPVIQLSAFMTFTDHLSRLEIWKVAVAPVIERERRFFLVLFRQRSPNLSIKHEVVFSQETFVTRIDTLTKKLAMRERCDAPGTAGPTI